jgi:hypothetical protein
LPDELGFGINGNLIVILPQRGDHSKLVGGTGVEYERGEATKTVLCVVNNLANGRLQTEAAAIGTEAPVVSEALSVASEVDLIVGLVPIAERGDEFRFIVALKARPRHDVKDAIGAVSIFGIVAAALNFEIVNILGVNLRPRLVAILVLGTGTPSISQST